MSRPRQWQAPVELELFVLPALIFGARIVDTTIGTVRIVLLVAGSRWLAALLGFIEVAIWLAATGGVVANLDQPLLIAAYAAGFAAGVLIGVWLEERIALGYRLIHVVNNDPKIDIAARLRERGYRVTRIEGHGMQGPVEVAMLLVRRRELRRVLRTIRWLAPRAFVTVERAERPPGALGGADSRFRRFPWSPLYALSGVRK